MNAAEIIELIKDLPPEERWIVADYLRATIISAQIGESEIPPEQWPGLIESTFDEHDELFRKLAR